MSDDYDEDFENYGSDFEDDVEVHHAVGQHSPHAASPKQQPWAAPQQPSTPVRHGQQAQQQTLPDASTRALFAVSLPPAPVLTEAEQRYAAATLRRSRALMAQVHLTEVGVSEAFRLEACSAYDLYSQGRGEYAKLRVAATQTSALGQDALDGECQTEEIHACDASSQAPDDPSAARSGQTSTSNRSRALTSSSNDAKLGPFLDWASPIILAELARTPAAGFSGRGSHAFARFSGSSGNVCSQLSAGMQELKYPALLTGRQVTALAYASSSSSEQAMACVAYSAVQMDDAAALRDHSLATLGVMCIWDIGRPAQPVHVLASEGQAASCCWGPAGMCEELVFAAAVWDRQLSRQVHSMQLQAIDAPPTPAHGPRQPHSHNWFTPLGMAEGGVCVWDLSERNSLHPTDQIAGRQVPLRRPSYTTEASADPDSCGAVVAVAALARSSDAGSAGGRAGGCQLLALSAWGQLSMYVVVQLGAGDMAAADTDKGVRAGCRVRLVKTHAGIRLGLPAIQPLHLQPPKSAMPQLSAHSLQVLSGSSQQLLVGADGGRVLRGACLGLPSAPREYKPHVYRPPLVPLTCHGSVLNGAGDDAGALLSKAQPLSTGSSTGSHVLSLHLSPFCADAFLCAHDNGALLLHSAKQAHAVLCWPDVSTSGLVAARWSPVRPCVFLVLDATGNLLCFDLMQTTAGPVLMSSTMQQGGASAARATSLEVPGCCSADSNGRSGDTMAMFMLGYDDGTSECHLMPEQLAIAQPGELEALQALLT